MYGRGICKNPEGYTWNKIDYYYNKMSQHAEHADESNMEIIILHQKLIKCVFTQYNNINQFNGKLMKTVFYVYIY